MIPLKRLLGCSLFVSILAGTVLAQEQRAPIETPREPVTAGSLVTATAAGERVRITAPASVAQMRVEVYATSGEKLFDNEIRGGNIFDWHLQDGQAQRLSAGDYVCVVTVKNISGKITQRIGTVTVGENSVSVGAADSKKLLTPQAQAIGPVEENASWAILAEQENQTTTVIAHDGTDGQIVRGRGAISFRLGDFFSGKDEEQMRLTEEGNLGVGTSDPQAKLDVAGVIRTRDGIEFGSGPQATRLSTTANGSLQQTLADGSIIPTVAGTGTQNRIAKWTDNAGTLGDTAVTETSGAVVIGNVAQTGNLQIFGQATQDVFAGMGADINVGPAFNYGYAGSSFGRSAGFFNVRPDASATPPNPSLRFMTANVQRMIVTNTGDVGIGTPAPGAKLDVAGDVNTSTQYNIGGNRVLSVTGTTLLPNTNTFAGVGAGTNNTTGDRNAFFGRNAGLANTTGNFNSFFGGSAGDTNVGGSDNTIIGFRADVGSANLTNATAIGADAFVTQSNSLVLGNNVNVGIGTTAPAFKLHVIDDSNTGVRVQTNTSGGTVASFGEKGAFYIDATGAVVGGRLTILENGNVGINDNNPLNKLVVGGTIAVGSLGSAGNVSLCLNAGLQISTCSSSIRYKQNINPFRSGLSLIKQLRPVSFNWRANDRSDLGLVAEEVNRIEPLLTTTNEKGEIEGVKYDRVGVLLVNAVNEQQLQIEAQQKQIKEQNELIKKQQAEVEALRLLVCSQNVNADICKPKN